MSDPRHDLKALEESIRRDAERVEELESRKAALGPTHPRVGELSRQIERIATQLKQKADVERQLTDEG
jgi:hypothetical protein